jgi:sugar phosphate isomerase/epimerase
MKTTKSRREFLKASLGAVCGGAFLASYPPKNGAKKPAAPACPSADPKALGIGLNLYTIREAMAADVPGSLKRVSDAGYRYVELAGYANGRVYGYELLEFKKIVDDLGMEILSSHPQIDEGITPDIAPGMAEDHAKLGAKYCIQHWIDEKDRRTLADYSELAAGWNRTGALMKEYGIRLGYHNHNFEFAPVEGKIPYYDVLMGELDGDLVTMEIDVFWAAKAGQNAVDIFKKYPGRFELFHLKDMFTHGAPSYSTDGVDDFAPVGAGVINFDEILAAKDVAGMKYLIVEQDSSKDGRMFEAIKTSITNLSNLL